MRSLPSCPPASSPSPLEEWTPAAAEQRAAELGLAPLGERRWRLLAACREEAARTGRVPDLGALARLTSLTTTEIARLFGRTALAAIADLAGVQAAPERTNLPTSRTRRSPRRFPSKEEEPHAG